MKQRITSDQLQQLTPSQQDCPRCGGKDFLEHDCGPDTYDDDITYTSYQCKSCGLWYDGWRDKWLIDVECESDEEGAKEYKP